MKIDSATRRRLGLPSRSKFNNVPTIIDGIRFSSQREGKRYEELKQLQKCGEVVWFIRQAPCHLPGGVKYLADFVVIWACGEVTVEDVKGMKTPMYRLKKRQVEAIYPIHIKEI